MSRSVDVLVVGAGPTGLTLALQAHAHGGQVRIVDRRLAVTRPSRVLIVHPRTLEGLRALGVTLLVMADVAPKIDLHLGEEVLRVRLADLALPETAFPHLTLVRQQHVETVLVRALANRGVEVEWERFFMYSEEIDLCRRLKAAGGRVRYVPQAEVLHVEGRSSRSDLAARDQHFQAKCWSWLRRDERVVGLTLGSLRRARPTLLLSGIVLACVPHQPKYQSAS